MEVNAQQLLTIIGQQQVEIMALRGQVQQLVAAIQQRDQANEMEKAPSDDGRSDAA